MYADIADLYPGWELLDRETNATTGEVMMSVYQNIKTGEVVTVDYSTRRKTNEDFK